MYVKQISVFIENTPGKLAHFTRLLGDHGIDLVSLSIADTTDFGILRCIVADDEKAMRLIEEAGYTARRTDVLAVTVPDRPGGLADILEILIRNEIAIDYLYSFVRNTGKNALIVFKVAEIDRAQEILKAHQVHFLTQEEICNV